MLILKKNLMKQRLLEKLTATQLVKNSPDSCNPKLSLNPDLIQMNSVYQAVCVFRNMLLFMVRDSYTTAQTQGGGPSLVGYPRLFIQYNRNHPPHVKAVSD